MTITANRAAEPCPCCGHPSAAHSEVRLDRDVMAPPCVDCGLCPPRPTSAFVNMVGNMQADTGQAGVAIGQMAAYARANTPMPNLDHYEPAALNAAADLVITIRGQHVLFSERYRLAAHILDIIEQAG